AVRAAAAVEVVLDLRAVDSRGREPRAEPVRREDERGEEDALAQLTDPPRIREPGKQRLLLCLVGRRLGRLGLGRSLLGLLVDRGGRLVRLLRLHLDRLAAEPRAGAAGSLDLLPCALGADVRRARAPLRDPALAP